MINATQVSMLRDEIIEANNIVPSRDYVTMHLLKKCCCDLEKLF